MGCSFSSCFRLDDLPAVVHCRRRRKSMDAAHEHFKSFAESHSAYMQSLTSVGQSLVQTLTQFPPHPPTALETKIGERGSETKQDSDRNSDSGHIQFTPSSDDENEDRSREGFSSSYEYLNRDDERLGGVVVHGSPSDAPPPPPPPVSSSTWDLMNFFAPYDMALHYPESYNLLRERTLIDSEKPEIKEVVKVQIVKSGVADVDRKKSKAENKKNKKKAETGLKAEESSELESQKKLKAAVDALQEVKVQFEKASEAGNGVLKLLKAEADENYVFQLDSSEKANLPSILRKLSVWEHKLYNEVKAEEEMRVKHEEFQRRLKKQDEKGSDAQKVDVTQKALMSLTPELKIAFEKVDRISIVSSNLRDEELLPCLKELIHELQGMWVALLDCHKQQAKAIKEVADLHDFPSDGEVTNAQLDAAIQLKLEFHNWIISFCNWIGAQKGYVKSLNKWLHRCLLHEPKELNEIEEPYWPSKLGAPLIFVICHKWSEGMKKIEDDYKVIEATQACVASVDQLLQRVNANIQQRIIIDGDLEKRVKKMEAKEKEMLKALEAWKKKVKKNLSPAANGVILTSEASGNESKNLQPGLKRTIESLEALAASFVQVYQDLIPNSENQMQISYMEN
ncbi:hypothetical protein QQ045_012764 [Rhodiola kirilowii]